MLPAATILSLTLELSEVTRAVFHVSLVSIKPFLKEHTPACKPKETFEMLSRQYDILAAKRIKGWGDQTMNMHRLIYTVVIVDVYIVFYYDGAHAISI